MWKNANCNISGFVQKNLNQNKISDTLHINNLNQLMTTGLSDINASFYNIKINKVINYLDKIDIKQSHLQDNIQHIVTNIQLIAEYQETAIKLQFITDKWSHSNHTSNFLNVISICFLLFLLYTLRHKTKR